MVVDAVRSRGVKSDESTSRRHRWLESEGETASAGSCCEKGGSSSRARWIFVASRGVTLISGRKAVEFDNELQASSAPDVDESDVFNTVLSTLVLLFSVSERLRECRWSEEGHRAVDED